MICVICGTEDPDDFCGYEQEDYCDNCIELMDDWYDKLVEDINAAVTKKRGFGAWDSTISEAVEEFLYMKERKVI